MADHILLETRKAPPGLAKSPGLTLACLALWPPCLDQGRSGGPPCVCRSEGPEGRLRRIPQTPHSGASQPRSGRLRAAGCVVVLSLQPG